jgi:hypothetical protein
LIAIILKPFGAPRRPAPSGQVRAKKGGIVVHHSANDEILRILSKKVAFREKKVCENKNTCDVIKIIYKHINNITQFCPSITVINRRG